MTTQRAAWLRNARKWLGLAVLASAFLFALRTYVHQPRQTEVVWLLTHLDRARLVELQWRVPGPRAGATVARGALHFAAGSAPDVTTSVVVNLQTGVTSVDVACTFVIAGATRYRTQTRVALGDTAHQTLDLGDCCAGCGP